MASLDDVLADATSDEVEVDFSAAVSFENLPTGTYGFEIEECEPGASGENAKNPGAPLLVWKFVVIDGEHTGRTMFRHSPITGKGSGLTKEVLKAIGVPDLDNPSIKFKRSTVIGQKLTGDVRPQKGEDDYVELVKLRAYEAPTSDTEL